MSGTVPTLRRIQLIEIREAQFPNDLPLVRQLFREYADSLGIDLCFQSFDEELAGLPGKYVAPGGGLWIAVDSAEPVGCIALRAMNAEVGEMKRLYVRPTFRGCGAGRQLAQRVIDAATQSGYRRIYLDTLPSMADAVRLYRSLGFNPIEPYCHNPIEGAMYFSRELK